jgi:hypothetical protein
MCPVLRCDDGRIGQVEVIEIMSDEPEASATRIYIAPSLTRPAAKSVRKK